MPLKDVTGPRPHRLRPGAIGRLRVAMKRPAAMPRPRGAKHPPSERLGATRHHAAMRRRCQRGRQHPAALPPPKAIACPSA